MSKNKEYTLSIDPRILELLGPSLYTNIYYVLAELIANAYDADAKNVYIIEHSNEIIVEDDGHGMSYEKGDIEKYLNVAKESRTSDKDSQTTIFKRRKMGRKGVGKLAALSVSENVYIRTIQNGEKSGFILSRYVDATHKLSPLADDEIVFEKINENGTSVSMINPQYSLNKSIEVIKKNLIKIFPLMNDEFKIHIIRNSRDDVIEKNDEDVIKELSSLITLGSDYKNLGSYLSLDLDKTKLFSAKPEKNIKVKIKDRSGNDSTCNVSIKGWLGAYKSTRGRKTGGVTEFPDNYISLYANKKMGEFNILPLVGENKLQEVYVVGQLHIDAFEDSNLPDMALSNRQGYKSDDPRYRVVLKYVKEDLLNEILKLRSIYANMTKKDKEKRKNQKLRDEEKEFREKVDSFRKETSKDAAEKIKKLGRELDENKVEKIISESLNQHSSSIGIKPRLDSQKKKILISHTELDKPLADIIYNALLFNGSPADDIIYSNCDDEKARIPDGTNIYDYLKDFFVDSYSDSKIWVIFVTSENIVESWGAMSEVGAAWITKKDHRIFNVKGFVPKKPLDVDSTWVNLERDDDNTISLSDKDADEFCRKIETICSSLGYAVKPRLENKAFLKRQVILKEG